MALWFKQFVSHILKTTNQHGVHSPFVYDLVTRCFYDSTKYPVYSKISNNTKQPLSKRKSKLLYRIGNYYSIKKVGVLGEIDPSDFQVLFNNSTISLIDPKKENDIEKFDLIYINLKTTKPEIKFRKLQKHIHNHSVLILDNHYSTKDTNNSWEKFCINPALNISIDTYLFGLIFPRKEQAKQHFSIRL